MITNILIVKLFKMTYLEVKALIKAALTLRPSGQKVLVSAHESAEIAILDYVESQSNRTAHGTTAAKVNFDLVWSAAFTNTNYDFTVSGFDASGNPVEINLVAKTNTKITVNTLVIAQISAIANSY